MKRNYLTFAIGVLLIAIFLMLLFTFQVRTTQVAVVTTFGKPTRDIKDPGMYFKWPWPVQRVYKLEKPIQNFEDKFTEDLTADNNNLLTSVYVGWRISNPQAFFPRFAGGSVTEAERILEGLIRSAKSAVVGKHPLSDFVSATGDGSQFTAIENEILATVKSQVQANNYGIEIEFLGIKRLGLPESVTQSVFERMTAERSVLVSKSQFEGEAEAQRIRSDAERRAAEMLSNAEGEAGRIQGRGEAEALKSLAIFEQEPALAKFLFGMSALEIALKERTTLFFDQNTQPFDLLRGTGTTSTNRATR